jgi:hypothetical protein
MESLSEKELVKGLEAQDAPTANSAVREILKRGVVTLPYLLDYENDRRLFSGTALINPNASIMLPMAAPGFPVPESAMDRATTLEVAALYMISAIYFGKVPFANAPLLTDLSVPVGQREARNSKANLRRGFESARKWSRECKERGIEKMREEMRDPLQSGKVGWY